MDPWIITNLRMAEEPLGSAVISPSWNAHMSCSWIYRKNGRLRGKALKCRGVRCAPDDRHDATHGLYFLIVWSG